MNTIVIETALTIEQNVVAQKLIDVKEYKHPITGTTYKVGYYNSKDFKLRVVVGRTNQTNINAAIETERIIQHFNPSYIFFVGVAGGLKDVDIGDIVIGSEVYGYEKGKSEDNFKPRPKFAFSSYELEEASVNFSQSTEWSKISVELVEDKFSKQINVYSGTIASGEKIDASFKSELHKFLKVNCSHALAIETEGLGFLETVRHYPLIKSLLIRGISDLINNKEDSDSKGSQSYASRNATGFLFGFIDYLHIKQEPINYTIKEKIYEIITKLYPEGLKDKGIWERAGGDLSLIHLSTTGKAQWIEALRIVENGGGGDIDYNSLINNMMIDFPQNVSLKQLDL